MKKYYVNKNAQANGDHEVHTKFCRFLPALSNRIYLGDFSTCQQAATAARSYFTQVDGCSHCSKECHKQ